MAKRTHRRTEPRFVVKISDRHLTIRQRGHAHLRLMREPLLGFQSWKEGRRYCIEYYFSDAHIEPILTEYTRRADWLSILGQIERVLPK